jgi:hypothetical protein
MRESGWLQRFVESAIHDGEPRFARTRGRFLDAARLDSHWNSQTRRRLARHTKYAKLDPEGEPPP